MIGLRPFLLRSAAAIGEGGLDDVAAFWAAVEWNAYLRRDNMLNTIIDGAPIAAKDSKPIVEDGRVVAYEMPALPMLRHMFGSEIVDHPGPSVE